MSYARIAETASDYSVVAWVDGGLGLLGCDEKRPGEWGENRTMDQQYDALIDAGKAAAQDKNWEEAIAQFSAAIDYSPLLAEGYYRRGLAQFDAGNAQLAAWSGSSVSW